MTVELGNVRVLPWDTPGLPPSMPHTGTDYINDGMCYTFIDSEHVPDYPGRRSYWGRHYCTRPEHPQWEVHVAHVRDSALEHKPVVMVVWGGE